MAGRQDPTTARLTDLAAQLAGSDAWFDLPETPVNEIHIPVGADANAFLIRWGDGANNFHDHDGSFGAIAVLNGRVREETLRTTGDQALPASIGDRRTVSAGEVSTTGPHSVHRVRAIDGPALTIEVYSPPLTGVGVHRIGTDGSVQRTLCLVERN